MREFRPQHLPTDIALIDLSFNRLVAIPPVLGDYVGRVNLRNNDFWFTMYSDLGTGFVYPIVVDELILAHRLGLIGTGKLVTAESILRFKKYDAAAERLQRIIGMSMQSRAKEEIQNTYNNSQNVHLESIQSSTQKAVNTIMEMETEELNDGGEFADFVCLKIQADECLAEYIHKVCGDPHIHSLFFVSVLKKVVAIIDQHEHKDELYMILKRELLDGQLTCMTGRITRIVNCLIGFVEGIVIGLSRNEEISNSILAIRKKYATMYQDVDVYLAETIPVVWQVLEDMCVPEVEHAAWLEYV